MKSADMPTQEDFLLEHIPYRLSILDSYCATSMLANASHHQALVRWSLQAPIYQIFTHSGVRLGNFDQVTNLTVESALISFRLLLEFLGLKAEGNGRALRQMLKSERKKANDGPDEEQGDAGDFGVEMMKVSQGEFLSMAGSVPVSKIPSVCFSRTQTSIAVGEYLAYTAYCANKASGHFVQIEKQKPGDRWYMAMVALQALVKLKVYEPLEITCPPYAALTSSLLDPHLQQLHRLIMDDVEQHIRISM